MGGGEGGGGEWGGGAILIIYPNKKWDNGVRYRRIYDKRKSLPTFMKLYLEREKNSW